MRKSLMLVPSLDCPAGCSYCFGPNYGGPVMTEAVVDGIAGWIDSLDRHTCLDITFHGGEPLTAGASFYGTTLPRLAGAAGSRRLSFAMQSNLWLLTGELCETFREYGVSLGTSLDGPERINDPQRGDGYFRRTMEGIELARSHGLDVGCVCTFTSVSVRHFDEVFGFFAGEGLDFTIHPALKKVGSRGADALALSPQAYGELLVRMVDRYLEDPGGVRIGTLDSLCRGVSARRGGICVFGDCLGGYLAVGPGGDIFPCQRLAGSPEYGLGNVMEAPSLQALEETPVWRAFAERQERVRTACGGCPHLDYCLGGCPYNVLAAYGSLSAGPRDPYCASYQMIFKRIVDLALAEVFSPRNLAAVVEQRDPGAGMLQSGRLLELMRDSRGRPF